MTLSKAELDAGLKQWTPLVHRIAWGFRARFAVIHEYDDIVAIGMVALWGALDKYDADNPTGASKATYLYRCVLYAYLNEAKMLRYANRKVAYEARRSLDEENPDGGMVFQPRSDWENPEEALLRSRREAVVRSAVRSLPKNFRAVIRGRYDHDRGFQEMVPELGGSRQLLQQRELAALKLLRPKVERHGVKP